MFFKNVKYTEKVMFTENCLSEKYIFWQFQGRRMEVSCLHYQNHDQPRPTCHMTPNHTQSILSQQRRITHFDSLIVKWIKSMLYHLYPRQDLIHIRYSFGEIGVLYKKNIGTGLKKITSMSRIHSSEHL